MAQRKSASSAREKQAAKKEKSTQKKTDFSDIPELSDDQLQSMKRVGRPPLGNSSRQLIALRVDPDILEELRKIAKKAGQGYQTLINDVLKKYVDKKSA